MKRNPSSSPGHQLEVPGLPKRVRLVHTPTPGSMQVVVSEFPGPIDSTPPAAPPVIPATLPPAFAAATPSATPLISLEHITSQPVLSQLRGNPEHTAAIVDQGIDRLGRGDPLEQQACKELEDWIEKNENSKEEGDKLGRETSSLQHIQSTTPVSPPAIPATVPPTIPAVTAAATPLAPPDHSTNQDFLSELRSCSEQTISLVKREIYRLGEGNPLLLRAWKELREQIEKNLTEQSKEEREKLAREAGPLQRIDSTTPASPPATHATAPPTIPAVTAAATPLAQPDHSINQDFLGELLYCSEQTISIVGNEITRLGEGNPILLRAWKEFEEQIEGKKRSEGDRDKLVREADSLQHSRPVQGTSGCYQPDGESTN